MNRKVGQDSVEPWNLFGAMNIRARRSLALPREIGSSSLCALTMASRLPGKSQRWIFCYRQEFLIQNRNGGKA